jgi:hypothetical protein
MIFGPFHASRLLHHAQVRRNGSRIDHQQGPGGVDGWTDRLHQ